MTEAGHFGHNNEQPIQQMAAITSLKRSGLKKTQQRELVLEILTNNPQRHFTAEDLRQILLKHKHSVSMATIYRMLAQFERAGLVLKHQFIGTTALFELRQHDHHDHLVCINCGRIIEFVNDDIERLQQEVAAQQGLRLTNHTLCIFGTCSTCGLK